VAKKAHASQRKKRELPPDFQFNSFGEVMPARTKRRAKFNFRGRPFVWWIENDKYLRISSLDKKFVIAYPMGTHADNPDVIEVIGHEFPGIDSSEPRPIWLIVPKPSGVMGAWVNHLLHWSFDSTHESQRWAAPPRSL
jgi:hypothetical protein